MKGGGVERGKCLYMYVEAKERQHVDNDNGERRGCKKADWRGCRNGGKAGAYRNRGKCVGVETGNNFEMSNQSCLESGDFSGQHRDTD